MEGQEVLLNQDNVAGEKEIIALINSKGTFISENSKANAELIAYIDCKTNELKQFKTIIEWQVSDEESKNAFIYNIEKYHIYHLKVKENGVNNNFLLIDVLEKDVNNEILAKILKEYEHKAAVIVEDPDLGKFTLDKNLKAFVTKTNWLNNKKEIDVYLNIGENSRIKALQKIGAFLNTFEKLINNKKEWDKKLKVYAAENLVDLANELRKNSKAMFKFIKIWKWRFVGKMELLSLNINPNGEFIATFDDSKMFLEHKIIVNGNVNGEVLTSAIVENFNIEDYIKVETTKIEEKAEENSIENKEVITENIVVTNDENQENKN